jgi:hypothetical protein
LGAVLLANGETGQLNTIAHEVAELPDDKRRDKTAGNEVVLEDISDPLGILGVGFLAADGFDVFGMSKDHFTGGFEDVVDGDPVFPCRLHTNILAIMLRKPLTQPAKVSCESGKSTPMVSRNALVVGCRDTSDDEGFVDINSTADWVNDFECHIRPLSGTLLRYHL